MEKNKRHTEYSRAFIELQCERKFNCCSILCLNSRCAAYSIMQVIFLFMGNGWPIGILFHWLVPQSALNVLHFQPIGNCWIKTGNTVWPCTNPFTLSVEWQRMFWHIIHLYTTHHVNIRVVPALSLISDLSFNGLSDGHLTGLCNTAREVGNATNNSLQKHN